MTINKAGLDLIKEFEGFRAETYRDSVGVLTIGYGTTAMAGVGIDPKPGMRITEAQAEDYLRKAVAKFAAHIDPLIKQPINENERAAFLSLAYNIGPGAFAKSSALRHFNQGNKAKAADAILLFNKAGGKVLNGLVRRRQAERALFLAPVSHKTEKRSPHVNEKPETLTRSEPHVKKPTFGIGTIIAAIMAGLGIWLADLFEPIRNFFGG